MIDVQLNVKFSTKQYKSFLNRLKKLALLIATVGIHANEGKQKVIRRYTSYTKGSTHMAGRSHRMTVAKLAYQNEFGTVSKGGTLPDIKIKPRYRPAYKRQRKKIGSKNILNLPSYKHSVDTVRVTTTRYSVERKAREQGYLLRDKNGKFVAYFKPYKKIGIPPRSFIRKTANELDNNIQVKVNNILQNILVNKSISPRQGMNEIAKLIELKMKQNIRTVNPKNHDLTRKAKGFNQPLIDEKDRLLKSIKYKVMNMATESGKKQYSKQFVKSIDKLLKGAEQYENKVTPLGNKIIQEANIKYGSKFSRYRI